MRTFSGVVILLLGVLLASSCNRSKPDKFTDTPTTGQTSFAVDATFQPIIEAELPVFHAIYKYAKVTPLYVPEVDAINMLLRDSVRLIVISRPLKKQETEYFNTKKFFPKEVKVALDGIAVLVNPANPDTLFSIEQLKKIFMGETTDWKQLSGSSKLGKLKVIFDNRNSSIVRFVVDSITKTGKLGTQLSAMQYNTDVVDYISKTPNAIGLIGVSWVSDRNDPKSLSFLKQVKVASISGAPKPTAENSYLPYQAYIATGQYPLTRYVYMINTEPRAGLASGFTAFVANDKGQRIILKTGVLPYTQPVRLVRLKDN